MEWSCKYLIRTNNEPLKKNLSHSVDFHLVDLVEKTITRNFIPSLINSVLINSVRDGVMVHFKSALFILGGRTEDKDKYKEAEAEAEAEAEVVVHSGASRLSFTEDGVAYWKTIRPPSPDTGIPDAVVVSDTMYYFGYKTLCPEFCDKFGFWKKLYVPDNLQNRKVSFPVVADRFNSRIIVHFPDKSELYAYSVPSPKDGSWELLPIKMSWSHVVAISDDVIYLYDYGLPTLLLGYDLRSGERVDVVPDVTNFLGELRLPRFTAMFSLSNDGLICLAGSVQQSMDKPPSVHFLTVKLQRSTHSDSTIVVNLVAQDYQTYPFPSTYRIVDFLLLQEKLDVDRLTDAGH